MTPGFRDSIGGVSFPRGAGAVSVGGAPAIGAAAMYFDGVDTASLNGAGGSHGSGNFTWEGYVTIEAGASASNDQCWFSVQQQGWSVGRRGATGYLCFMNSSHGNYILGSAAMTPGTTYKWSVTRASGTCTLRLNGVSQGTVALATSVSPQSSGLILGATYQQTLKFKGHLDEVHMASEAIYTADYTPAFAEIAHVGTSTLLMHGDLAQHSVGSLDTPTLSAQLFAPTWPMPPKLTLPIGSIRNVWYGGLGRVQGTVKNSGAPNYPVHRRVELFRMRDSVVLASQWSDPVTGAYDFQGVDPAERYFVVAYDHTGVFRAVIADNLTPTAL